MRIVDLSKRMSPDTPVYPGDKPIEFETQSTHDQGYHLTRLHFSTHSGTHLDAPMHFLRGGAAVDAIDLERCYGPAHCLDLRSLKAREEIDESRLRVHAAAFAAGARVIIRTGWPEQCPPTDPRHFADHPVLTPQACRWIASRRPALLGMDLPSPHSRDHLAAHGPLLEAGVVLLEGLVNLEGLPDEFILSALPLPLKGVDGSPVRAVAIVP